MKLANKFNIPLVIYGEDKNYLNDIKENSII